MTVAYSDDELPAGTIDGSNTAFTLSQPPNPGGSLKLFRNGLLMSPAGVDYTLSSSTITFGVSSVPQTGDSLYAWYRYDSGGVTPPPDYVLPRVGGSRRKQEVFALTYKGERRLFNSLTDLYNWFLEVTRTEVEKAEAKAEKDAQRIILKAKAPERTQWPTISIRTLDPQIREAVDEVEKHVRQKYHEALMAALAADAEELDDIKFIASLELD